MNLSIEICGPAYKFLIKDAEELGFGSLKEYIEEIVYDYYHARKHDDQSEEYKNIINEYIGGIDHANE